MRGNGRFSSYRRHLVLYWSLSNCAWNIFFICDRCSHINKSLIFLSDVTTVFHSRSDHIFVYTLSSCIYTSRFLLPRFPPRIISPQSLREYSTDCIWSSFTIDTAGRWSLNTQLNLLLYLTYFYPVYLRVLIIFILLGLWILDLTDYRWILTFSVDW